MTTIYIVFAILILGLYLLSILKSTRVRNAKEAEEYLQELEDEIQQRELELSELDSKEYAQQVDEVSQLKANMLPILTVYEESGIKLPADIYEELGYQTFETSEEVLAYIENQRQFWKLENTKKPFIRKRNL